MTAFFEMEISVTEPTTWLARGRAAWERQVQHSAKFGAATYPALVVGVAVFAYFMQPVLRFVPYYQVYGGVVVFGMSLILVRSSTKMDGDAFSIVMGLLGTVLGTWWLGDAIEQAVDKAVTNDKRCWVIEQSMLNGPKPRIDLAELFNALGCRPQGVDDNWTRQFPKQSGG